MADEQGEHENEVTQTPTKRPFLDVPCLWETLSISALTATAVGLHRYRNVRSIIKTLDFSIPVFCIVGIVSWVPCRLSERQTQKLEEYIETEIVTNKETS